MKLKIRVWSVVVLVALLVAVFIFHPHGRLGTVTQTASRIALTQTPEALRQRAIKAYGKQPLSFEVNQGQSDSRVKFLSRGRGYTLFLTSTEALLALQKPSAARAKASAIDLEATSFDRAPRIAAGEDAASGAAQGAVLRMKLVGAKPVPRILGMEELPAKSNYFIGNNPAKWRFNVANYAKVKYQDIYPGVDLIYYGNQRELEYDFVVASGADPRAIRLSIHGAKGIRINAQGDLVLRASAGDVTLHKPVVYQAIAGRSLGTTRNAADKQLIEARYVLRGKRQVGLDLGAYDATKPLILDPVLSYSTYLGGSSEDEGNGIAVDSAGNAYVTGFTGSTNFPTAGAYQSLFRGPIYDAFVTKINANGSGPLIYSTYLGGTGLDFGNGIAVDNAGNAYVVGETSSGDFPTRNAFQSTLSGPRDAFVTKLDTTRTGADSLVYSTYFGGGNVERGLGIAIDSVGNAYVTGMTNSSNFPTKNPLQLNYGGGLSDAFVAKLDTTKTGADSLIYSSYLGGRFIDEGRGIAADPGGSVYVTGSTNSTPPSPFPTTASAFQTTFAGGLSDAFVTKIDTTQAGLASLIYSTFLGGSSQDDGNAIAVDSAGNAYVTGFTGSDPFPTTPDAFRITAPGAGDAFVTKLNATGTALIYSTYLGGSFTVPGSGRDEGLGIAADNAGNAYVTGSTRSTNFPTRNPVQAFFGYGSGSPLPSDAFITKIDTTLTGSASLIYSTYLGGEGDDYGLGIAIDRAGNAYVAGQTTDSSPASFPRTAGAFQTTFGGVSDAFVARIETDPAPAVGLDPVSLNFGNQAVTSTSAPRTVTLTNSGRMTLNLTSITLSGADAGQFVLSATAATPCAFGASMLAPAASCTFNVTFSPTTTGAKTAHVQVLSNAASSPDRLPLTGTGVSGSGPAVSLDPSSLAFGNQTVDTTSTAQTVTLRNTGDATLVITSLMVTGPSDADFTEVNTCGASVNAGESCAINITFKPTATGNRTAAVTIVDNAAGSPHQVNLTGAGISAGASTVTLSASSLTFASQFVGTTSAALNVSVRNAGEGTLTITSVTLTGPNAGDFAKSGNCGGSINAGASCTINITFTPADAGERTAAVSIEDNGVGGPHGVELRGTGSDFSLRVGSGASASATVMAGQTASYSLEVVPASGFTGSVGISCSGAPTGATCMPSPASGNVSSAAPVSFSISVVTTARAVVPFWPKFDPPERLRLPLLVALLVTALVWLVAMVARRLKPSASPAMLTLLLLLVTAGISCGGGVSGTPAGTFTLTVTGSHQGASRPVTLTLTVN